jgi:plastocyanin
MHRTIGLAFTFVLLPLAARGTVFAQTVAPQAAAPRVVEVSAKKYEFSPAEIRVKKGETRGIESPLGGRYARYQDGRLP